MYPYNPYQSTYQQTGFIHVQSEREAMMYPVSYGGSVSFINDREPYCYTKTAGATQFDAPIFRKFKLIEEPLGDAQNSPSKAQETQAPDDTIKALTGQIGALTARIEALEKEAHHEPATLTTDPEHRSAF